MEGRENKKLIENIAEGSGIKNLENDVINLITFEVEYRVREILINAQKLMLHSNRKVLLSQDIHNSIKMLNLKVHNGSLLLFRNSSAMENQLERTDIPLFVKIILNYGSKKLKYINNIYIYIYSGYKPERLFIKQSKSGNSQYKGVQFPLGSTKWFTAEYSRECAPV